MSLQGFKQFILRGNVVDLAVGVVVGAAFNNIVNSLVKDFITPIVSAIFSAPELANMYFTIHGSKFMYGDFINSLISFLIIATVVYFFVVVPVNTLVSKMHHEPPADPTSKKCPQCFSEVPIQATRCAFCTQEIPEI